MKKLSLTFCLAVCIAGTDTAVAQKKLYSIAEATNGMTTTLATKGLKSACWQPETDALWQVEKKDGKEVYKVTNYAAKKIADEFVEPGSFPSGSGITGTPALKWLDRDHAYAQSGKHVVLGSYADKKWMWNTDVVLPDNADNVKVDKSGKITYTVDNNLWFWSATSGHKALTNDLEKNVVNGQSVHRNEFGIETGTFLSPAGNYVAYYHMDQTMVNDYPIIRWDTVPALAVMVKYPMAGGVSHQVQLRVCKPGDPGAVNILQTDLDGEKDHYLTSVTWSPDEKYLFLAILNRDQNHLWLNKYDAATGKLVKTLFEEKDAKYVHPTHSLVFLKGSNDEFIWWSARDGYEHLYLYNTDGALKKQLTKGEWVVNDIAGYDEKDKNIIFTASKESPIEKHIYTVNLETTKMNRVDTGSGMHNATCADDGRFLLDVYSAAGVAKNTLVRSVAGQKTLFQLRADNTLTDFDRPQIKDITVTAADGKTTLYGKLIMPLNFDPSRKYPVIVYLYNGPNVQLVHNNFPESGNLWYEYMAQHGYAILSIDGRGSANRGMAFEQVTFRNLGDAEMDDQLKGVDYLKSLSWVDQNRIGVYGWSFGGFMTTSLMLKHPGVFKCAVAGGPVIDWKMYEVMYTERYMDRPQDNPEGYAKACLLDKVKNLKGKLMLIHGAQDNVVVWQHSVDFIKKAVDEAVQVDYFVYPGHEHNVRGKDRVHLMDKISKYFMENL